MSLSKYQVILLILGVVILETIAMFRLKHSMTDYLAILAWGGMLFLIARVVQDDSVLNVNTIWCGLSSIIIVVYTSWALKEVPSFKTLLAVGLVVLGVALLESA
jgi:drug/metabolite transporter (DMT)-like permease